MSEYVKPSLLKELGLSEAQIARCRQHANEIVGQLMPEIKAHSTDSIERAILRFWGVEGELEGGIPLVNAVISRLRRAGRIEGGVAAPLAALLSHNEIPINELCVTLAREELAWPSEADCAQPITREIARSLSQCGLERIRTSVAQRIELQKTLEEPPSPWLYVIVATGNIYEDVKQAVSAVSAGADCIAVIRSTAQSLLDYVPEGATTEGFGGTYATGKNFAIMREALDEAGRAVGRYIRLVNYASGLCMPEITVLAAQHRLDMLLNDSMYGIIFRDIHRLRTLIDQFASRRLCAAARIIINTGEDNYLTTADAIEAAHTVLTSQLINEAFAQAAGLPATLMGLGHAFEVNPWLENSLQYELAMALLVRAVFPQAPIKYMPPTRHKSGDIFFSHAIDCMFNFTSAATGQSIHLCGMLTEALHTPFIQDRFISLEAARYIRSAVGQLQKDISFRADGFICKRAASTLDETEQLLDRIARKGLLQALAEGVFADIKRPPEGGRGGDGVFLKSKDYLDPFEGINQ